MVIVSQHHRRQHFRYVTIIIVISIIVLSLHTFIMAMMPISSLSTLVDRCLHHNRYRDIIIVFVTFIVNRHIHVLQ